MKEIPAVAAAVPSPVDTSWTQQEVCALFSEVMSGAVLISGGGIVHPVGKLPPGRPKVLNWAFRYLDEEERAFLFRWAGMEYRSKHGHSSIAKKDYYKEMEMGTPSGVSKRKSRLCAKIALCLTRDAIPKFGLRQMKGT